MKAELVCVQTQGKVAEAAELLGAEKKCFQTACRRLDCLLYVKRIAMTRTQILFQVKQNCFFIILYEKMQVSGIVNYRELNHI